MDGSHTTVCMTPVNADVDKSESEGGILSRMFISSVAKQEINESDICSKQDIKQNLSVDYKKWNKTGTDSRHEDLRTTGCRSAVGLQKSSLCSEDSRVSCSVGVSVKSKGNQLHRCDTCMKVFKQPFLLKRHLLSHTGEKSYMCSECNRYFRQAIHLTVHMRRHTGEKPYACSMCSKAFAHSVDRRRHETCHTGETPYSCDFCMKRFSLLKDLKRHTEQNHKG